MKDYTNITNSIGLEQQQFYNLKSNNPNAVIKQKLYKNNESQATHQDEPTVLNAQPVDIIRSRVVDGTDFGIETDVEDAFYVADLGDVVRQHRLFQALLPRVQPFYAMKCCPNAMVMKVLNDLGTGFDCASKGEIESVLAMGVDPCRIIYANPCKQSSHLRFAASSDVKMMTFDNAEELRKIKMNHPNAQLVLRVLTDNSRSLCNLGLKFGASLEIVPELLRVANDLNLNVIGISFHVGSGCFDASAFGDAVVTARQAFDLGLEAGFDFNFLDSKFLLFEN